jgi:DNA-binding MarR family transcriptional regulator
MSANIICGKGMPEFLMLLEKDGRMYVEELGERTGLSGAWVARNIDRFEAMRVIQASVEGRKKFIELTAKGKRVAAQVRVVMGEIAKLEEML